MLDTPFMLWELSVTEQRYRAVLEVLAGVPVTGVADRYGMSRQSVHAWLGRYRSEGPPGLADRSHKVHAIAVDGHVSGPGFRLVAPQQEGDTRHPRTGSAGSLYFFTPAP
jgi:hypothetical protein